MCACSSGRSDDHHRVGRAEVGAIPALGAQTVGERQVLLDLLDDVVVHEVAGHRDDDVPGNVVRCVIPGDVVARHRADRLLRSRNLTSERMRGEQRACEHVVHEIVGGVVAHSDLFQDHLPLRLELVEPERGRPHDPGQDLERERQALIGDAHVERRRLLTRERVHVAADRFDRLGDLRRVAIESAFEQEVLEKVARSRDVVALVARAGAHPEADRDRPQAGKLLGDDAQAGPEAGSANAHASHRVRHRPAAPRS